MKKIYGFQIDSDYVNERMSENHDQIFDIENRSRRNNLHLKGIITPACSRIQTEYGPEKLRYGQFLRSEFKCVLTQKFQIMMSFVMLSFTRIKFLLLSQNKRPSEAKHHFANVISILFIVLRLNIRIMSENLKLFRVFFGSFSVHHFNLLVPSLFQKQGINLIRFQTKILCFRFYWVSTKQ